MYFTTHLGLIFLLYPGNIISSTQDGHWLPIMIGFGIHILAITFYLKGLEFLGNKDMITLFLESGKGMSLMILLPVALYSLMICIITVRAYSEIMTIVFLSSTPLWAVMVLFLIISTYIAFKGMGSMLRTSVLIVCLCLPVIVSFTSASFQNIDWRYIFPLVDNVLFLKEREYFESFFAFAGGFLFLGFVQPFGTFRSRGIYIASLALLPFLLLSVYIPVLTFGQATASTFHFPYIVALDTIYIPWLMFDRITIFFFLCLIMFTMLFLSVVLWSTMRVIHRSFPVLKPSYILLVIAIFVFMICLTIPAWEDIEEIFWWNTYLRFYILFTVPVSTFVFGKRYKRKVTRNAVDS